MRCLRNTLSANIGPEKITLSGIPPPLLCLNSRNQQLPAECTASGSRRGLSLVPCIEFYLRDLTCSADHGACVYVFVCVFFFSATYFRENQEQSLKTGGLLCGGPNFGRRASCAMRTAHRCSPFIRSFNNLSEFHKKCLRARHVLDAGFHQMHVAVSGRVLDSGSSSQPAV